MDLDLRTLERGCVASPNQEMFSRLGAALARSGDTTFSEWMRFLGGHWTLEPPTRPGAYYTKDRQHNIGMIIHVCETHDDQLGASILVVPTTSLRLMSPSDRWMGYWWSEPTPSLPVHTAQDSE